MTSQNIKIGIDLGTTNSEIAVNNNGVIEIIKNRLADEYTPSVFGFDKAKNPVVGKKSYQKLYRDATKEECKNYKAEIKRLMGTPETVYFERKGVEMNAEEISAEILKSLKEDILKKYPNFNTLSAVITTPASFSTLQSEATKRAGNLAGFKQVVLLQEPIAAAISYGFMNIKDENWLIYDLGGGTFDAALISSKDGVLSVLGYNGNNWLGGKDFDGLIVDEIIVPRILEKYSIDNFNRGNDEFKSIFYRLKYFAETSKIDLSQYDKTVIEIDGIGGDDSGNEICLSINFSREEFEKLIEPMVDQTIELSKATLEESGIKNSSVNKIILVGGPTQISYIRKRLEQDLKITVDSSVDPLTVVARGACIFAISQKIQKELQDTNITKGEKGIRTLNLNYETLSSENEETISGTIKELKDSESEYYLQIQSDSGFYSSSKGKLKNGKFFETVRLEENKENLFWIYLFDKEGNSVPVEPDSFTITHGLTVSGAPLPHSIGVSVIKKDISSGFACTEVFVKYFEKGELLPLKGRMKEFATVRKLNKDESDNPLWIIVREGESDIPDRNTFVCELGIKGNDLPYDLPEKTPIEITIEINESRELFVTTYIPLIDLTLNARSTFQDETVNIEDVEIELNKQIERAKIVSENCSSEEKSKIDNAIQSVSTSLNNADIDEDEKRKTVHGVKDLKKVLDQLEKEKEMPRLIKIFNTNVDEVKKLISNEVAEEKNRNTDIDQLSKMKTEGEKAISENDKLILARVNDEIEKFKSKVVYSNIENWIFYFKYIIQNNINFINNKEAQYYIEKGKRAIEIRDRNELEQCTRRLMQLIPSEEQENIKKKLPGITY